MGGSNWGWILKGNWRVLLLFENLCVNFHTCMCKKTYRQLQRLYPSYLTREREFLTPDLVHIRVLYFLKGTAVKVWGPLDSHTLHICAISSLTAFILRSLYQRPWAEVFFRLFCWGLLIWDRREQKTVNILSLILTQYPVLSHSYSFLPALHVLRVPKTAQSPLFGLSEQWANPTCALSLATWLRHCFLGEKGKAELGFLVHFLLLKDLTLIFSLLLSLAALTSGTSVLSHQAQLSSWEQWNHPRGVRVKFHGACTLLKHTYCKF